MKAMNKKNLSDIRVKRKLFPISVFLMVFVVCGFFTTVQMQIIGQYLDYPNIPLRSQILVVGIWFVVAAVFTLWTNREIIRRYQKPIEEFSEAARQVASGDFSVYLAPHHTADKHTHLDVLFTDFNKMVEELGSIETLKTDFISNVSHEMKTPISIIKNYAELLQSDEISAEKRKEFVGNIENAAVRLSNLISNILKLNKLENQRTLPEREVYNVCGQLGESILLFEEAWEKKEIELDIDIEDAAMIEADESLMELVWNNLISNAVKFTERGGKIAVRQTSDERQVKVEVSDNGCGMTKEQMAHIFDKFYQGDTSHAGEGNGLGLSLTKRVLELMDGEIAVTSEKGKGSCFTVILQVADRGERGYE